MRFSKIPVLIAGQIYQIAIREWGHEKNAPSLLCVHGLTRNSRDFEIVAQALSKDWRVICIDMPGRGESDYLHDKENYNIQEYCKIALKVIDMVKADHLAWLGTSMGGIIGMTLSAMPDTPIKRLILNDVGPFVPAAALKRIATYISQDTSYPDMDSLETHMRRNMTSFGLVTDEEWRFFCEISSEPDEKGGFRLRYDRKIVDVFKTSLEDVEFWPVWDAINIPTLVIRGEDSDILTSETAISMTKRGPKAELFTVPSCGHAPMLFKKEQIERITKFLS